MAIRHRQFPRNAVPISETVEMWFLIGGLAAAVWLIKSNTIVWLIAHTTNFALIGSFIEGFFFTSMVTTAPAIVAILESASYIPAWELAVIGGIGAVCGDILVFRFLKSRLVEHILSAALHPRLMRVARAISRSPFWWLGPICGMVVIASPLPDEIGLLMMGLSRIRFIQFVPLAFAANAAGIFLMALAAQQLT